MKYYGVMCCELDGSLEDIDVEADFKPNHEQVGFSFVKWFKTHEARDKTRQYLSEQIAIYRINRRNHEKDIQKANRGTN